MNETVDIMVDRRQKNELNIFVEKVKIRTKTIVEDLEKMIEEKEGEKNWRMRALDFLRNGRSDAVEDGKEDFGLSMKEYHSYDDIVSWMRRIEAILGNRAKVISIGKTVEGRDIWGIKVSLDLLIFPNFLKLVWSFKK